MRRFALFGACVLATASLTTNALATSWEFDLVNRSNASILSFQTREGGAWSRNWLDEIVVPGEVFIMDFGTNQGDCRVRTRMDFSDGTFFDGMVDYCSVSTITVRNNDVVFD